MREQWQPKIGGAPGERVNGLDELAQSLTIVLQTPLGSVPGRPRLGSRLHELIDADLDTCRAYGPRYARDAVVEQLPRLEFLDATPVLVDPGRIEMAITWRPVNGTISRTTNVPISP